jgi:hypothetical protein
MEPSSSVPLPVLPAGPSFLQGRPDGETIDVCFVDGAVGGEVPPPVPTVRGAPPTTVLVANRAVLLIDTAGHVYGYIYGRREGLPLVRPTVNGA